MNRRNLKKQISYVCGDIALECHFAANSIPGVDVKKLYQSIIDAAQLQVATVSKVSVSFDKTPGDFESRDLYNKARASYYKKAYAALLTEFNNHISEIVKQMNSALPAKEGKTE